MSEFGPVLREYRHDAKGAVAKLSELKAGEAIAALHHPEIGDIWGKEGTAKSDGFGLARILKFHPEVVNRLQDVLSDMVVRTRSKNRVNLESEKHRATVRLEWDGKAKQWLLTAFEKRTGDKTTTDTLAVAGKDDTASLPTGSSEKIIEEAADKVKTEKAISSDKEQKIQAEKRAVLFFKGEVEGESILTDVEFDAVFKRVTARLTDTERTAWFAVAQTFEELPPSIKAEAYKQGSNGDEISGVFHSGKVYLVKDRIVTEKWLEEVILHEWHGHAGLKGMFGKDGRLQHTQELLEATSQPIELIAELVGFGTATSLRQHFRNAFGVSPGEWRKSFRNARS